MSLTNDPTGQFPFNDPDLKRYVSNLKAFISLFPPGKMNVELWHLACLLYDKHDETNWQYSERFKVCGMYRLLRKVCDSMEKIVWYFEGDGASTVTDKEFPE